MKPFSGTFGRLASGIAAAASLLLFSATPAAAQHVIATIPSVPTQLSPLAVGVNPASHKIYIANFASNSVTVIDGATNTLSTIKPSGMTGPVAIAVDTVFNIIYVANAGSNNVTMIDGTGANAPVNLSLGSSSGSPDPVAVAVSPTNHNVYVCLKNSNQVTVYGGMAPGNPWTTPISTSLLTSGGSTPIAVAADSNPGSTGRAFVVNNGGNVKLIDGTSQVSVESVGSNPVGVAVDPVNEVAYVISKTSGRVDIFNTTGNTIPLKKVFGNLPASPGTPSPVAVTVDPVRAVAYIADAANNQIDISDDSANFSMLVQLNGTPTDLAVDPITNLLYVTTSNGLVEVVDIPNQVILTDLNVGTSPVALGIDPVTNRLYAVNKGSNNISVVDGMTNETDLSSIATGENPVKVAVNRATGIVYVLSNEGNSIERLVEGPPLAPDSSILPNATGSGPVDIAIDEINNLAMVANQNDGSVTIFNDTASSSNSVQTGNSPSLFSAPVAIAFNPLTNKAYVVGHNDAAGPGLTDTVTVISNPATTATTTVIDLPDGTNPTDVAINPDTNRIYVVGSGTNKVTVIDGAIDSIIGTISLSASASPLSVAVNPVTNKIYVGNAAIDTVSILDGSVPLGSAFVRDVVVGDFPTALAINEITDKIYVVNENDDSLSVIDGVTNVASVVTIGQDPRALAVNPTTNKIFVANTAGSEISVVDGITFQELQEVTGVGSAPVSVAVDTITNHVFTANADDNNASGILEQSIINPYPVTLTISGSPVTNNPLPTFNVTANDAWVGTSNPPTQSLYFQFDTWQGPWTYQNYVGCGAPCPVTAVTPLSPGIHVFFVWAGDGQESTSINNGPSNPIPSEVQAFLFEVSCPPITSKTVAGAGTYCVGDTVTLTANAVGQSLSDYQWYLGANPLSDGPGSHGETFSGTHTATLTITNVQQADGGIPFSYKVTDACDDTITSGNKLLTINPLPSSNFTSSPNPAAVCNGSSITFTAQEAGDTYKWVVGNGGAASSTAQTLTITPMGGGGNYIYSGAGTFSGTLTVTNGNGCKSTSPFSFTIYPLPTGTLTAPIQVCAGATNVSASFAPDLGDAPTVTYLWSIANGATNANLNATTGSPVTFNAGTVPGTFTLQVIVTDGHTCSSTFTQLVTVNPAPVVTFTAPPPVAVCDTEVANAYTTSVTSAPNQSYFWAASGTNGGANIDSGQGTNTITWHPITGGAGTAVLTVTVTNTQTGCSAMNSVAINVTQLPSSNIYLPGPPLVQISHLTICFGTSTIITGPNGLTYQWTFPSGNSPTTNQNLTIGPTGAGFVYTAPGVYNITLTTTDPATHCSSSTTIPVTVGQIPSGVLVTPNQICSGATFNVSYTRGFNDSAISTVAWTVSGGNTINTAGAQPLLATTVTATQAGPVNFTITAVVTDVNNCVNTFQQTVHINPLPVATINVPGTVWCDVETSSSGFTASVAPAANQTYLWSITNGVIDSGQGTAAITWHPTTGGGGTVTIGITVTNTNTLCASTSSSPINITALPSVTISGPTAFCQSSTNQSLTGSTSDANAVTYAWSVTAGAANVLNLSGTTTKTLKFDVSPSASASTTFQLAITDTVTGCVNQKTYVVTFNALPPSTFTISPNITRFCDGGSVTLTGPTPPVGGSYTYFWNIVGNSGNTAENASSQILTLDQSVYSAFNFGGPYPANKTFTVTLTVTDNTTPETPKCSSTSATTTFVIQPNPSATITVSSGTVCASSTGNTASVPAAGGPGTKSYAWSIAPGGVITAGQNTDSITWSAPATNQIVTISVVVTDGQSPQCSASGSAQVNVDPKPVVAPITSTVVVNHVMQTVTSTCLSNTVTSSVPSTQNTTYVWLITFADNSTTACTPASTTNVCTWTANISGTATIAVTATFTDPNPPNPVCTASNSTPFNITAPPVAQATADSLTVCESSSTVLHGTISNSQTAPASCVWAGSTNALSHLNGGQSSCNPTFTSNPGDGNNTFTFNLTVTDAGGCTSTNAASIVITTKQAPSAPTVSNDGPYCVGDTIVLHGPGIPGGSGYSWTGPNGFTSTVRNPQIPLITTADGGTYSLVITNGSACSSLPGQTAVIVDIDPSISKNFSDQTNLDVAGTFIGGGSGWSDPRTNYAYRLAGMTTASTDNDNTATGGDPTGVIDPNLAGNGSTTGYTTGFFNGILAGAGYPDSRFTIDGFFKNVLTPSAFQGTGNDGQGWVGVGLLNKPFADAAANDYSHDLAGSASAGANGSVYLAFSKNSSGSPATIHAALHDVTGTELAALNAGNPYTATYFTIQLEPGIDASGNPLATGGRMRYELDHNNVFTPWVTFTRDFVTQLTELQVQAKTNDGSEVAADFGGITMLSAGASSTIDCPSGVINLTVSQVPGNSGNSTTSWFWTATGPGSVGGFFNDPTLESPTFTPEFNALGEVDFKVVVTLTDNINNHACSTTATVSSTISQNQGASISQNNGSGFAPNYCAGDTVILTANPGNQQVSGYQWYGPNGLLQGANLATLTLTNVQPGATGTYNVVITYVGGCTATVGLTVTVNALPTVAFTSNPNPVCSGGTGFVATALASDDPNVTYNWTINAAGMITSGQGTNTITYNVGTNPPYTTVTITVTATDSTTGCTSAPATQNISINSQLSNVSIVSPTAVCQNSTGNGAVASTNAGLGSTYVWTITNGTINSSPGIISPTNPNPIATFSVGTGPVTLTITLTSLPSGCVSVASVNLPVNLQPAQPTLVKFPTGTLCQGDPEVFVASGITPPISTWSWYRDGVLITTTSVNELDRNADINDIGTHHWKVTVTDNNGCVSVLSSGGGTVTVVTDPGPVDVTAPSDITLPQNTCDNSNNAAVATSMLSGGNLTTLLNFLNGSSADEPACPNLATFTLTDITIDGNSIAANISGNTVTIPPNFTMSVDGSLSPQNKLPVVFTWQDPSLNTGTGTANITLQLYGDLNQDGVVNSVDATILAQYLVTQPTLPPGFTAPLSFADLNGDSIVNSVDLTDLLNYEVGNFDCLPVVP